MILSIVNQKGGVGKTTTAVNLGAALARAGHPTLLVDLDPQGNTTSGLAVPEAERVPGVYEVLRGDVPAGDALRATNQEGLMMLPATADLAGAQVELLETEQREFHLRTALASVHDRFAYIIIDTPPSLGILTVNALVAAERVLIPVQSEYYALEGLGQLLETITLVRDHLHPQLDVLGAVLTMVDKRVKVAHDVIREVREHFPGHVFETVIPRSVRLTEAPSYGQTIFAYDERSQGARAYEEFAREVHERVMVVTSEPIHPAHQDAPSVSSEGGAEVTSEGTVPRPLDHGAQQP